MVISERMNGSSETGMDDHFEQGEGCADRVSMKCQSRRGCQ